MCIVKYGIASSWDTIAASVLARRCGADELHAKCSLHCRYSLPVTSATTINIVWLHYSLQCALTLSWNAAENTKQQARSEGAGGHAPQLGKTLKNFASIYFAHFFQFAPPQLAPATKNFILEFWLPQPRYGPEQYTRYRNRVYVCKSSALSDYFSAEFLIF